MYSLLYQVRCRGDIVHLAMCDGFVEARESAIIHAPRFVARAFMCYDPVNAGILTVDTILTCTEISISSSRSDTTWFGVYGFLGKHQYTF